MKPWRFYGRTKVLTILQHGLDFNKPKSDRLFQALKVRGRRGVGKTQLLHEIKKHSPEDVPVIICQIPEPDRHQNPSRELTARMVQETNRVGGADRQEQLRRLLAHRYQGTTDRMFFMEMLTTLLKSGAVIVLDEFHLSKDQGLPGDVREVIDAAARSREETPGKLVLMGSHQQKFDAMFAAVQPLFGRIDDTVKLRPWCLKTIMAMAAEQGILANPGQFLTLWTAYGGIPRYWERYCCQNRYSQLHGIADEKEWRQAFLDVESGVVANDAREQWDGKDWVELPPEQRDMLVWIGQNRSRGVKLKQIPPTFGEYPEKLNIMNHLRRWVDLVDMQPPVGERMPSKWFITEPNTLFQISVFRDLAIFKDDYQKPLFPTPVPESVSSSEQVVADQVKRLETLEGGALEQLTGEWLATKTGATWVGVRVEHPGMEGDIDVLGWAAGPGPKLIWLGSCKRNAEDHAPELNKLKAVRSQQDAFMQYLVTSATGEVREDSVEFLQTAEWKRLLVSPLFSPRLRQKYAKEGFELVDIPAMAGSFGIELAIRAKTARATTTVPSA